MLEIAAFIFAFALFIFLAIRFWDLSKDSDNTILSVLFGFLTIVFISCASVSYLACIGTLLAI